MSVIVKCLKNTELEAVLKIKSEGGGEITVPLSDLVYKPDINTCQFDTTNQFQDVSERSEVSVLSCQWSAGDDASSFKFYRGAKDLEHLGFYGIFGDTCALELDGQLLVADTEYAKEDLIFDIVGNLTIYIKLRKAMFDSYSGESPQYGAFEDESVRGPGENYIQ